MKAQTILFFFVLTVLLAGGCTEKKKIEVKEEVRPVKTIVVKTEDIGRIRYFPGKVDASRKAELSFRVSGRVIDLLVKEGDQVVKGQLIAKLDPADFQITVNDKNALFVRAQKDYLRGKKLVKEGHISKMDFDRLESAFLSARADLDLAKQQLSYTQLKAPFDGTIAQRFIQNFEEVQAKQNIVILNDNSVLEIKFNLPENLLLSLQKIEEVENIEQSRMKYKIPVVATFSSQNGKEFPLKYKEIATKADENTQTFSATYTMSKPVDFILLPGMTASVKLDLSRVMVQHDNTFYVPVSAVIADEKLKGIVWVVDEKTMIVHPVSVKAGVMNGNQIQVTEGLKEGMRIVVAGVPFLYDGLKVSLWQQGEQAADNLPHERPVMLDRKPDVVPTVSETARGQ